MARIKWEDRKYNAYFTMEGIGRRGKTRTDKDLKRRLAVLGFRSYWRKLELYRKQLISRISHGAPAPVPWCGAELQEEALLSELRIMLANLRSEVSSNSPGGVKHLLEMIEEIIRLISRVFYSTFSSFTPCFAGGTVSSGSYPRGPPLVQAPETGTPGPENWIQTRPRILEISSKLNTTPSRPDQAPFIGSENKMPATHNSLIYKTFKVFNDVLTTGTAWIVGLISPISSKAPGVGGYLTLTLGGLVGLLGAYSMPKSAEAAPGDRITRETVSTTNGPTGISYNSTNGKISWMNQLGEVWQGRDDNPSHKILNSADSGDSWKFLAEGDISGTRYYVMFNDTDDTIYIRNASSGVEWRNFTAPYNFGGVDGLTIDNNQILCYNKGWGEIQIFSLTGTHLDDMLLPYPEVQLCNGIAINPVNGDFIMNKITDTGFYNIFTSGTTYLGNNFVPYNFNTSGVSRFDDISYNPNTNQILIALNHPYSGWADEIYFVEGPAPTPTPTPPDLESKIGIFRPSSGLWAIKDGERSYFGGNDDIPIYRDFNGDGTNDIGIFRPSSGLWAIKGLTRSYFGGSNDEAVPGDFNGDGTNDIAIFRPSSGLWAIKGVTRNYFGGSNDSPVPDDYNGNGTIDVGIFRSSSGLWAVRGVSRAYFGGSLDRPVPGDYAGDGAADIGIFRPTSGLWAIKGVTRSYFGGANDEPVPGDYAADGNDDLGIFRDSSGLWAIKEVTRAYFGRIGDMPLVR